MTIEAGEVSYYGGEHHRKRKQKMQHATRLWSCGIFELWHTDGGQYIAVNTVTESTRRVSQNFALEATSLNDNRFIDMMSLLVFD
jgi:hypothetical protein